MPWKPWGWHWFSPSYNNVAEEEESSTAAHEEDDDIEALRFHLAPDEIVNSAFTLVDEEEEQKSAVEQQQYQYASPTRHSPRRREQGRLFTPLPQADIEEGRGGLVAGGDETSPVRSHRVVELHIDTTSDNMDGDYQDDLSDLSIFSGGTVQDDPESVEGSVVPIQHGCYESWRGFVTKRNIGTCALLVMRCALAFDFFLQLQRNLADISISLHSDPDQKLSIHSLQWTRVFVPVWLLTIYPFCHNLYNLVCVEFDSGNRNSHLYHGFTPYVCLAWGCAFSLGLLVWMRLEGVLDTMPVAFTMIPCWTLAFFGTVLLHFSIPPEEIEGMDVEEIFAFQAEMSIASRLNLWIFGFQCTFIALKLDTRIPISWSRALLPTVLLLITIAVIIVPFMLGICMTCMRLARQLGLSCDLAFSFITSATPLLIFGAVVYFSLSGLSLLSKALSGAEVIPPSEKYKGASEALNPFLQLCASLTVLLPLFVMTENNTGLLELMSRQEGFTRGDDGDQTSEDQHVPSPKFRPMSSPMVLLKQGAGYFQQASRSIRHKLLYSPLQNSSSHYLEDMECYVCIANAADAVVLPCGHSGLCMQCAKSIVKGPVEHRHCPMCRAEIERVVNVGNKTIRWDSVDFVRCEDGVDVVSAQ